jgi:hypothetical protein
MVRRVNRATSDSTTFAVLLVRSVRFRLNALIVETPHKPQGQPWEPVSVTVMRVGRGARWILLGGDSTQELCIFMLER